MTEAIEQRFWSKVGDPDERGCWPWRASKNTGGYGRFGFKGRNAHAHRVAIELTRGAIAEGLLVCHRCDNPSCVNPDHLFLGTHADNTADMVSKGRNHACPGELNPRAKLSPDIVRAIRASTEPSRVLAQRYGVTQMSIRFIKNGRTWRTVK